MIVFAGFLFHVGKMVFGEASEVAGPREKGSLNLVLMSILLVAVLGLGLYVPSLLNDVLEQIAQLFPGGGR
jgi:hypothetical protein